MNAKKELLGLLKSVSDSIKCASIRFERRPWNHGYSEDRTIDLKEGYSPTESKEFFHRLDFEYDNGFGGQELFGTIWLMKENTWLERGEYDGSEWWAYKECPKIPDHLKRMKERNFSTSPKSILSRMDPCQPSGPDVTRDIEDDADELARKRDRFT
jgi:hypothetical protein